jgi:hypothetical protein
LEQAVGMIETANQKPTLDFAERCDELFNTGAMLPDGGRALRNSKDPNGAVVFYTNAEWTAFLTGTKNGEFDDDYENA